VTSDAVICQPKLSSITRWPNAVRQGSPGSVRHPRRLRFHAARTWSCWSPIATVGDLYSGPIHPHVHPDRYNWELNSPAAVRCRATDSTLPRCFKPKRTLGPGRCMRQGVHPSPDVRRVTAPRRDRADRRERSMSPVRMCKRGAQTSEESVRAVVGGGSPRHTPVLLRVQRPVADRRDRRLGVGLTGARW
jgi:hypothetical protein